MLGRAGAVAVRHAAENIVRLTVKRRAIMNSEQFRRIVWPSVFTVRCMDGTTVKLLRGDGVSYQGPDDDPSRRGMICATMFPARAGQRNSVGQCVYLDEIRCIENDKDEVIWGLR